MWAKRRRTSWRARIQEPDASTLRGGGRGASAGEGEGERRPNSEGTSPFQCFKVSTLPKSRHRPRPQLPVPPRSDRQ